MALIPRPASAPISPCENGLVGRPVVMLGAATLLVGSNGAARLMSGDGTGVPAVRHRQPARLHRMGHLGLDAGLDPGSPLRQLVADPGHHACGLAVDHLADVFQQRVFMPSSASTLPPAAPPPPELMNIRAGVLPNMPM